MHGNAELAGHTGAVASSPWPVRAVARVRCGPPAPPSSLLRAASPTRPSPSAQQDNSVSSVACQTPSPGSGSHLNKLSEFRGPPLASESRAREGVYAVRAASWSSARDRGGQNIQAAVGLSPEQHDHGDHDGRRQHVDPGRHARRVPQQPRLKRQHRPEGSIRFEPLDQHFDVFDQVGLYTELQFLELGGE